MNAAVHSELDTELHRELDSVSTEQFAEFAELCLAPLSLAVNRIGEITKFSLSFHFLINFFFISGDRIACFLELKILKEARTPFMVVDLVKKYSSTICHRIFNGDAPTHPD